MVKRGKRGEREGGRVAKRGKRGEGEGGRVVKRGEGEGGRVVKRGKRGEREQRETETWSRQVSLPTPRILQKKTTWKTR